MITDWAGVASWWYNKGVNSFPFALAARLGAPTLIPGWTPSCVFTNGLIAVPNDACFRSSANKRVLNE